MALGRLETAAGRLRGVSPRREGKEGGWGGRPGCGGLGARIP